MTELGNERVAYFNGEILPESRVALSFRDTGFLYGDGVFDTTRTFRHKPFRLNDHVKRLFRSLKATGIDPGLTPERTIAITEEVLSRNLHPATLRLPVRPVAAALQPALAAALGQGAYAADIGGAFGDADDPARVQQIEQMARLHALVVGR